ncbi:MAG: tandem-95 repeat protein, partial [Chloroflexi bacterium]|nr:tandem-95 repeat protein [Chloroflexota bacterium]
LAYTVSEGDLGDTATVTITVNAVNDAPIISEGATVAVTMDEDGVPMPFNLTLNATDAEGDPLAWSASSQALDGVAVVSGTGTSQAVAYTPNPDYNGTDSFIVQVEDASGDDDRITVNVTINAQNDAPSAGDDILSVLENSTNVTLPVLRNDTVAPDTGETLTIIALGVASMGTVNINGTADALDYTAAPGLYTENFTYTVSDGSGGYDTATVYLSVDNVNDMPVASDDVFTILEDSGVNELDVIFNDYDPDVHNVLTITITSDALFGTVSISGTQSLAYVPDLNFSGIDFVTYTVTDGILYDTAAVTITVLDFNAAPTAVDDAFTVDEDSNYNELDVLANDSDSDGDSVFIVEVSAPISASIYVVDNVIYYAPDPDFVDPSVFTYTIGDGNGGLDTAFVAMTINGLNDAPVAVDDTFQTNENVPLNAAAPGVMENDYDVDGDTLTAVLDQGPVNGTITLNANGSFEYVPPLHFTGIVSFTYHVSDGTINSNIAMARILVRSFNLAPLAVDDEYIAAENTPLAVAAPGVLVNDTEIEGDPMTAVLVNGPVLGTLNLNGNGSFIYTPEPDFNGVVTFTYYATDGWDDSGVANVTINVINSPPVALDDGYATITDMPLTVAAPGVLVNDSDAEGDLLAAVLVAGPADGTLDLNANGGFVYTPASGFNGDVLFTYYVDDGVNTSHVATVTISVKQSCTQGDFLAQVTAGESGGTISLDGSCIYKLTSSTHGWNGGNGAVILSATRIEGNGAIIERDAGAPAFRLLTVYVNPVITIRNLTFRGGQVSSDGGGLFALRPVVLENVRFEDNTATGRGGALFTQGGQSTLRDVTFAGNTSDSHGGAVYAYGDIMVERSHFVDNAAAGVGGAMAAYSDQGRVVNSVFAGNQSGRGGAAILTIRNHGQFDVIHSTFSDQGQNSNAALFVQGSLNLTNTIVANHNIGLVAAGGAGVVVREDHNLFAGNGVDTMVYNAGTSIVRGANSLSVADPRFVDPVTDNYQIQPNSSAIDRGTDAGINSDAAGNARPYYRTGVDIGAYEYQGQGLPSLSIVKAGPPWVVPGREIVFALTVANDSVMVAANLRIIEDLPDGAVYVGDSASDGGTFAGDKLTWDIGTLLPGERKQVTYTVTADQTLLSDDYRVFSLLNSAVSASGTTIEMPLNDDIVAELGFFPQPDGFGFSNYGDSPDSDVTVDDMIYIYGADVVCKVQNPCELTATAEQWRKTWLELLRGGHCAGMAMGSLSIFENDAVNPGDFQAGANVTYDITKDNARKFIALYAATQTRLPANWQDLMGQGLYNIPAAPEPVAVLDHLIANFNDVNAPDRYRISFSKYTGGGGHAVTPYAVEQKSADEYWLYVYDNNYPDNFERVIKINRSANTWVYDGASTRPGAPLSTYHGDAVSRNIRIKSLVWSESFPKMCDSACTPSGSGQQADLSLRATRQSTVTLEFQLDGEGYLLITRSGGERVGYDPLTGEFIAEIPGAEEVFVNTGLGFNAPPMIRILHEPGMTYDVQITNRENAYINTEAEANLNIFGPGYVMRLRGLKIDSPEPISLDFSERAQIYDTTAMATQMDGPYESMGMSLDPVSNRLAFQNSLLDAETPTMTMALNNPSGPDYVFEIAAFGLGSGQSVAMAFDWATGSLIVENNDIGSNGYYISVDRLNIDGTHDIFVSDSVTDGDGVGALINVGEDWDGTTPPVIEVNYNPTLPPMFSIYLPAVMRNASGSQ